MIGISSCSIEEITLIQTIINPLADHFSSKLLVIVMVVRVFLAEENFFPLQSLKIFTFRVKLSESIFFWLGHSSIVKLI